MILALVWMLAVTAMAAAEGHTVKSIPNVHVADRHRYVSNPDGVLSAATVDSLDRALGALWSSSTAEPVVVAVNDIAGDYTPAEFATELGELWGVGKSDKDNGLVVLLVKDRRQMFITTGRGMEGVLPDALCGRIVRNVAAPYFRRGDYDGGMRATVDAIARVISDPAAAEEIASGQPTDSLHRKQGSGDEDLFGFVVKVALVLSVLMLGWVVVTMVRTRRKDELERYTALNNLKPVALFLSFLCLGMALPAYLLCAWKMHRLRDHRRNCPNCGHAMRKLDEETDNRYLTPAQDLEEQIDSIDYDVWLCDNCGETDVIPYVNKNSAFTVCERCGARAVEPVSNRIVVPPTTRQEGVGMKVTRCRNCGNRTEKSYRIARKEEAAAAAPIIIGGLGGLGRGGGGGFGGGSFGGGSFGGGGGGGSW